MSNRFVMRENKQNADFKTLFGGNQMVSGLHCRQHSHDLFIFNASTVEGFTVNFFKISFFSKMFPTFLWGRIAIQLCSSTPNVSNYS